MNITVLKFHYFEMSKQFFSIEKSFNYQGTTLGKCFSWLRRPLFPSFRFGLERRRLRQTQRRSKPRNIKRKNQMKESKERIKWNNWNKELNERIELKTQMKESNERLNWNNLPWTLFHLRSKLRWPIGFGQIRRFLRTHRRDREAFWNLKNCEILLFID